MPTKSSVATVLLTLVEPFEKAEGMDRNKDWYGRRQVFKEAMDLALPHVELIVRRRDRILGMRNSAMTCPPTAKQQIKILTDYALDSKDPNCDYAAEFEQADALRRTDEPHFSQVLAQWADAPECEETHEDGLEPPDLLWWKGKPYRLGQRQWALLSFMEDKARASQQEVVKAVWGDPIVKSTTLRALVSNLNDKLLEIGLRPCPVFSCRAGYVEKQS